MIHLDSMLISCVGVLVQVTVQLFVGVFQLLADSQKRLNPSVEDGLLGDARKFHRVFPDFSFASLENYVVVQRLLVVSFSDSGLEINAALTAAGAVGKTDRLT